ncbi:MAG: type II secretion system protein [Candidatus Peregrinibacteria bacterium Greene0416_19]|nr:MAG: type II secretion system protein [Candidatus Peregrinibacteria bacterium Greene0416_19]
MPSGKSPDHPASKRVAAPLPGGDQGKGQGKGFIAFLREYVSSLGEQGGVPVIDRQMLEGHTVARSRPVASVAKLPAQRMRVQKRTVDAMLPAMEKTLQEYMKRRTQYRREAEKMRNTAAPAVSGSKVARRFGSYLPFLLPALSDATSAQTESKAKSLTSTSSTADKEKELESLLQFAQQEHAVTDRMARSIKEEQTEGDVVVDVPGKGRLLKSASKKKEEGAVSQEDLPVDDRESLLPAARSRSSGSMSGDDKDGVFHSLLQGLRDLKSNWESASRQERERLSRVEKQMNEVMKSQSDAPSVPAGTSGKILGPAPDKSPSAPRLSADSVPRAASTAAVDQNILTSLLSRFGMDADRKTSPLPPQAAGSQKKTEGKKKDQASGAADKSNSAKASPGKPDSAKASPGRQDDKKKNEIKDAPKPPPRRKIRNSGFLEFIGAIKYFGMGKERISIIQNLATMLNAGLPLVDSVRTLQMETRVKPAKKLLGRIVESVESGTPLWRAMEEQHFFSPHAIALIRIGEEAGNLAENMEYLALQQEKDQGLRQKVKMAMIYPTIVLSLMFIIVMGLGLFVLPNLVQVLFSLNVKLPLVTRMVIAFTNGFTKHGKVMVPSILAGIALLVILAKFTPLKVVFQWVLFRIPGIGRLATEATLARFGVILGGLLQAGVPLVDALKSLAEVTPIVSYKRFYQKLLEHISIGDSFSKSFALIRGSTRIIPVSVQQLIITGERTGSLAKIMLKIADIYEKKANDTAAKLPVILEPMLLLFIGGLVGTIAFAIIVPIYSIVGNVGN